MSDFRFHDTLSRWRQWRHFVQKTAATWWMHTQRQPGAYAAASASSWSWPRLFQKTVRRNV